MGLDSQTGGIEDDDLTSLSWLQNTNLLRDVGANLRRELNEVNENLSPPSNYDPRCSVPPITYDPQIHVRMKPPFSFSSLIFLAIESSPEKALPVKDIYSFIARQFPYYSAAQSGWKNTIRHNLSLNKSFRKLDRTDRSPDDLQPLAKGSLWCIDPEARKSLLEAVQRTPGYVYPYMSIVKTDYNHHQSISKNSNGRKAKGYAACSANVSNHSIRTSKRLFLPILSTSFATTRESKEADAAESMLTLKQQSTSDLLHNLDTLSNDGLPSKTIVVNPSSEHSYCSYTASPTGLPTAVIVKALPSQQPQQHNPIDLSNRSARLPEAIIINPSVDHSYTNSAQASTNEGICSQPQSMGFVGAESDEVKGAEALLAMRTKRRISLTQEMPPLNNKKPKV